MILFDYIYYRIYYQYKVGWNESIPGLYALLILSFAQLANLNSLLFALSIYFDKMLPREYAIAISCIVLILNVFRYRNKKYNILNSRWENENQDKRETKTGLIVFYIGLSVFLFFYSAVKFGKHFAT